DIALDDEKRTLSGYEKITYINNSPDELRYLWLQLDQNVRARNSISQRARNATLSNKMQFGGLQRILNDFDGGFKITSVADASGKPLPHTIVETMMRVDLPFPLKPGGSFTLQIKWWYNINNRMEVGGRSGYEFFEKDSNCIYTIAQFFPRMCVYNNDWGWQHKQFLGRGEFTLPFGDYEVNITVPSDFVVAATGECRNPGAVLTTAQRSRLQKAQTSEQPTLIITPEEALKNEDSRSTTQRTWQFRANRVRDFAFAGSRKFIWDAMGVEIGGKTVMCMSFYPKEGNPLWGQYSTEVVAHTIRTYSHYTIDYPYPVAQSIHAASIGMEYPMICFNGGRPEPDGTYSEATKYGMIGVITHEVGHNFFPMIINSDERQWTWMDEGLNTFVQYLTQAAWSPHYPHRRGPAHKIVDYMKGDKNSMVPIMTNSESLKQFGNNAYAKPATALNILRETVLGRELFDFAFKEYCRRWAFKHPTPADFFRSMEDASGIDLDWFWRGWFYTTDHVDIAIESVKWMQTDTKDPDFTASEQKKKDQEAIAGISKMRNDTSLKFLLDAKPELRDFYDSEDRYTPNAIDREEYEKYLGSLSPREKELLYNGLNFYELKFRNVGGLVMPIVLRFEFADATDSIVRLPAEVWISDEQTASKVFWFTKSVTSIVLDPYLETADVDTGNNFWPARAVPSRFELFKERQYQKENPMQRFRRAADTK
ncbi:MAG: M1 family metallopeptidase, partial [Flavobacteriales bacterium]|nr:M1 family metallopeptidase [Flavobacteriales bacterium]